VQRKGPFQRKGAQKRTPQKGKSRKKKSSSVWQWWPVLAGVVVAPFAVRSVDYLALTGRWAAWLLVPWTFLLQGHSFHLPEIWADHLVEGVMYAQFPIYGLLLVLLHRRFHFGTSVGLVLALHMLAFASQAALATS
jgi:hypothetical protein